MDEMLVTSKKRELRKKLNEAITPAMAIAGSDYTTYQDRDKYRQVVATLTLLENNAY